LHQHRGSNAAVLSFIRANRSAFATLLDSFAGHRCAGTANLTKTVVLFP
jgi:hypothetical protein